MTGTESSRVSQEKQRQEVFKIARENDISIPTAMESYQRAKRYHGAFLSGYTAAIRDMASDEVDLVEMSDDELHDHVDDLVREWAEKEAEDAD